MKKKLVLISVMISFGLFGACNNDESACNNVENDISVTSLCDTSWKLYGFGTVDAHIQIVEPSGCSACYVVKFNPDGSFSGKTTSNDIVGIYSTENKSFKIVEYGTTKVGEVGDGYRFVDAFRSSVQYEIANGKLKLYNNNNDFLIFNPQ